MATFHLINFGCRASQADGFSLKLQLTQAGLVEAESVEQSQVAVLNTCTVTGSADAEVRQIIRRIHRANPACKILVTGCYAQRAPEEIARLQGVAWVVGNSHKQDIQGILAGNASDQSRLETSGAALMPHPGGDPSLVQIAAPPARILVGEISEEFHFAPVFPDDRTRPTLKVQDGCGARCSFCIIPSVRGDSRSLRPEKVIEQIRELVAGGYKEIVLSGINLGSYGRDFEPRLTFLQLLEEVLAKTGVQRIRISSIEPMDVSPELIALVEREPRMARHFHVPLQSGCDRILRAMNRRYWASHYAERILAIRSRMPDCGIGADVMVGFPGETDEDHAASMRFIDSLPFTYLHIFPYSSRPGTPAAARHDQVNGRVAHERGKEIRALISAKRREFLEAQVGEALSALALDETEDGARVALSSNYLKIVLPESNVPPNTLLDIRVGRAREGLLYGYPAH